MKIIKQTYHINAPVAAVWKALVGSEEIAGWGGGPAKMSEEEGFSFSLWGGSIWGKNIKVVKEKELVQEWYSDEGKKWEKPSIVTFILHEDKTGTKVKLLHKDVPEENINDIADGWKEYYLGPLKEYLEKKQ